MLFKLREKNYEFRVQRLLKILDIIQFENVYRYVANIFVKYIVRYARIGYFQY